MTLAESARGAVWPWNGIDAGNKLPDTLPQQEIDVCLCCPLCVESCDRCSGDRQLRRATGGHPRTDIDIDLLRDMMRLRKTNAEMCAALGIGLTKLQNEKKKLKEVSQ